MSRAAHATRDPKSLRLAPGTAFEFARWVAGVALALARLALAFIALILALASNAHAQDFAVAAPAGPAGGPSTLLERGLPDAADGLALEGLALRWDGLDDLTTRALAAGLGWRRARLALGLSQTGVPEVGWTGVALGVGVASASCGVALRAAARRDRDPLAFGGAFGRALGAEAGFGAWLAASPAVTVWASAPQVWTRGAAAPLARPLECGARIGADGSFAWLAHRSPGVGEGGGELSGGLACRAGSALAWVEGREHPLRASLGLSARARFATVEIAVDGHPVLGETVRLGIRIGARPGPEVDGGANEGGSP